MSSEMFASFWKENTVPIFGAHYELKNNALCGHHNHPSVIRYQWLNRSYIYINFQVIYITSEYRINLCKHSFRKQFNPDQFGYLPSHSYTCGKYSRANWLVYCDLSNAITTIPHSVVLCKISNFILSSSYSTAINLTNRYFVSDSSSGTVSPYSTLTS
jgi:hypothetical protein